MWRAACIVYISYVAADSTTSTDVVRPADVQTFLPDSLDTIANIEDKLGPILEHPMLLAWDQRVLINDTPSISVPEDSDEDEASEFYQPGHCVFPIEVVLLQDVTTSFTANLKEMLSSQLPLMRDALSRTHPNSQFGLVSFRDKPIRPLGDDGDYCQRFESPLSRDFDSFLNAYSKLKSSGGGDPPENQFGAIVAASQSTATGWSNNKDATRLIVMVTDSSPHYPEDGNKPLPPFSGHFNEAGADKQCVEEGYPTAKQVRDVLKERDAYVAFLVFDHDWSQDHPVESWKWFNRFIGQSKEFINVMAEDSSDFWTQLSKVIAKIEAHECKPIPTKPPHSTSTSHECLKPECNEVDFKLLRRPKNLNMMVKY